MISFLMQVVGLQNWVSKLQIHVESQTSTFLHHRRETVTTLLTERGLVSKLSARGRMVGVRHKLMPHPISKYFSVSFFFLANFSNSIIFDQVETKKITAMKEVWMDFDDFPSLFTP